MAKSKDSKSKMEDRKPEVRKKSATIDLPVKLNKAEIIEKKNRLLKLLDDRDNMDSERKSVVSDYKARIDILDSEVDRVRTALRTDEEKRPVMCDQHFDWKKKTVTLFRSDTGARVHERAMHKDEMQKTLDEAIIDAREKKGDEKPTEKGNVLPMTKGPQA